MRTGLALNLYRALCNEEAMGAVVGRVLDERELLEGAHVLERLASLMRAEYARRGGRWPATTEGA